MAGDPDALRTALAQLDAEAEWRAADHVPRCRMIALSTAEINAVREVILRALEGADERQKDLGNG